MGLLLSEALRSLCGLSHWCYAVFWKIDHRNPKLLIWEECHYEPTQCPALTRVPGIDVSETLLEEWQQGWVSAGSHESQNGFQHETTICILIEKMLLSNRVILVGEGLVGGTAFTGERQWIHSQNYVTDACPPEVSSSIEVHLQFSAGMQTIAVIPILPHGVVQLGSYLSIKEDIVFVNEVQRLILQLGYVPGALFTTEDSLPKIGTSVPVHPSRDCNVMNYVLTSGSFNQQSNLDKHPPSLKPAMKQKHFFRSQPRNEPVGTKLLHNSHFSSAIDNSRHLGSLTNSCPLSETSGSANVSFSSSNFVPNGMVSISQTAKNTNLPPRKRPVEDDPFQALNAPAARLDDHLLGVTENVFSDLFDVLGSDFKTKPLSVEMEGKTVNEKDEGFRSCLVSEEICKSEILFGTNTTDHLLDAVVSNVQCATKQHSEETASCRTNLSNVMQGMFDLQRPLKKAGFQEGSIYGSTVEQGYNNSSVSTKCSNTKPNRNRLKPGESPRPRPKDRQMIQDRVKELREIVPDGAKCSIDALLERTIKHMLFLQSVTKHADKLRQSDESKIISKEGGILLEDNLEGGATWAFEVGSQSMVCPIIVEDLNPPRQMLVEMLCEERGFFLEIADIIRGLGLTILKGVMEVRNGKIWARFAVEANKDTTRMEIFMALVGILDQTATTGPLSSEKDDAAAALHQSCRRSSSMPSPGFG